MSLNLHNLTAVNLFAGANPDNSAALVLKDVTISKLEASTKDFSPSGGPMSIELMMPKLNKLDMSFNLDGQNPTVDSQFMAQVAKPYTVRANIFDVKNQTNIPVKGLVRGKMVEVDMGKMGGDDGVETAYRIAEITHYEWVFGNVEKYYFNFFEGFRGVRIDGAPIFEDVATNLGL
jgi:phage tail tube protein FII